MEFRPIDIKGIEGLYMVSDTGIIFSKKLMRLIGQYNNNGYKMVHLVCRETYYHKAHYIHNLVATAFIGERPKDKYNQYDVNHIDMDRSNNNVCNLEYITHQQNIIKARNKNNWQSGRVKGFEVSIDTKTKMALKKHKKCYIYNDTQRVDFNSIQECYEYLNTYRQAFNRCVDSCNTHKGFYIRYLK